MAGRHDQINIVNFKHGEIQPGRNALLPHGPHRPGPQAHRHVPTRKKCSP